MLPPIQPVRQPLLPRRRKRQVLNANAPIVVKLDTSKPTKSASYHFIDTLLLAFLLFLR